ncbi:PAS domain S-box protein [Belnapia sp. T18]|uniref:histidine kinase n=1 Tax=Belnapia arida TaxID=2804533 RepID=A0ABS1TXQ2_9PROT|nr:HWE histidine kinase domain-containing protein [Belnapia arida]MBL6077222.1 PAS domain S-box protein [Belnapia arida]
MPDGDARFRLLADNAPVMVWRADPSKACDFFNRPWLDFTGRTLEQELGFGWAEGVHPDDFDRCLAVYTEAFDARRPFSMQYRLRRHDGAWRWLLDNGRPYENGGGFAGYFGSCIDVTEMKQALDQRDELVAELTHRIKNTLAVVVAMAEQTRRTTLSPEEFHPNFLGRLHALSRAHDALFRQGWIGTTLELVVREALAPHMEPGRITIAGPAVTLPANRAVALGIALHELATNAVKHGALSTPAGQVRLWWGEAEADDQGQAWHLLHWEESGGPPVPGRPARRGMGTQLLEGGLARQIRGAVTLDFAPAGLRCIMRLPAGQGLA